MHGDTLPQQRKCSVDVAGDARLRSRAAWTTPCLEMAAEAIGLGLGRAAARVGFVR